MDQEGSSATLDTKRSAGVAPEVNLGMYCMQVRRKHTSEGFTLALNPRADVTQRSKTGISVAPQKGPISSKIFKPLLTRELSYETGMNDNIEAVLFESYQSTEEGQFSDFYNSDHILQNTFAFLETRRI